MPKPPAVAPRRRPLLRRLLGDALRRRRLEQGRTLADVADAARISMQYLSELERGRKEASSEILSALCDALYLDLTDLLADAGRAVEEERERAPVVRLESIRVASQRADRTPTVDAGPGDVYCLAA